MKKKICIIYTGGTIGMIPTDKGYAPGKGSFATELESIDSINKDDMPKWDLIEFDPLLDSSNISVDEWNKIGRAVYDNYNDYDGFVVLHGTDTMAYTASAVSFMLENLSKPVIFTGSQIPLCRIRSDARDNLLTSMIIAATGKVREVCLYFGGKLLRGNRAVKTSADGLIAFESPNCNYLAEAGIDIVYNEELILNSLVTEDLNLTTFTQTPIGVLKIFPGIQFNIFEAIMTDSLRGIVLETFGAGNIPTSGDSLLPIIEKAFVNGTIVTVCSQCQRGTVKLGAYQTSAALTDAGAVSGFDMTTEAAVAKLYYLFSLNLSRDRIKAMMEQNLRGELSAN